MQTPELKEGIKKTGKSMEKQSPSSLRWGILRDAFLPRSRSSQADNSLQVGVNQVSRRTFHGYNLIPCRLLEGEKVQEISSCSSEKNDVYVSYTLPLDRSSTLVLRQRVENHIDFDDFDTCRKFNIDNTGLVCHWPSEEVLAHFCLSHADIFRSKRILELGAGYGLAGLVIAASTDASEVVISDGNPKVVDYIQHNINANSGAFADTKVRSMILHWNQDQKSSSFNTFDIIVASDCTFFKEFHGGLAQTVKSLLKDSQDSEAIFISPRRGDSLDKFLEKITETGLHFNVTENYDKEVWERHQKCLHGASTNYEKDHCYPLLVRITS